MTKLTFITNEHLATATGGAGGRVYKPMNLDRGKYEFKQLYVGQQEGGFDMYYNAVIPKDGGQAFIEQYNPLTWKSGFSKLKL